MKIVLLSTSRADQSALEVAAKALREAGHQTLHAFFRPESLSESRADEVLRQLEHHLPDLVVLHGDRWDCLIAATACTIARVPIFHIGGGDLTIGSYDQRFRDAISQLADWHFVGTAQAALRLSEFRASTNIFVIGEL